MKNAKIQKIGLVVLMCFLGGLQSSQAQFWKKIKDRVQDGAENAVLKKTEQKTTKTTENAIDSIFKMPKKMGNKKKSKNENQTEKEASQATLEAFSSQDEEIALAESYSFEWKYVMKIESEASKKRQKKTGDMKFSYLLSTHSTAFATQFDMPKENDNLSNTLMVIDPNSGVSFTLMEVNGEKIIQKMPSFTNLPKDKNEEGKGYLDNAKIKKIGSKKILGYTCQGFEITLEEGISKVYINPNAPVSFNHGGGNPKFAPKGVDVKWLKSFKNGLMMEMTFTSFKKPKHNMKMTCVALVKESFTVNIKEYKSFMNMGN